MSYVDWVTRGHPTDDVVMEDAVVSADSAGYDSSRGSWSS